MSNNLEGNEMLREAARILRERSPYDMKGFVCNILMYELEPSSTRWTMEARIALCRELKKFILKATSYTLPDYSSAWLSSLAIVWDFKQVVPHIVPSNIFRAIVLEEIVRGCRPEDLRERVEARRFEIEEAIATYPEPY